MFPVVQSTAVISGINWTENFVPLDILPNLTFHKKRKKKKKKEKNKLK